MSALAPATTHTLDPASRAWLVQLRAEGPAREAALGRLHALLLREARHEVRRRTAGLAHPSGRDLDDLAMQAADDALVVILRKLDQFRGDALFTTWARRFAALEVPGELRRRLGHTREAPTDGDDWPPEQATYEDPEQRIEAEYCAGGVPPSHSPILCRDAHPARSFPLRVPPGGRFRGGVLCKGCVHVDAKSACGTWHLAIRSVILII